MAGLAGALEGALEEGVVWGDEEAAAKAVSLGWVGNATELKAEGKVVWKEAVEAESKVDLLEDVVAMDAAEWVRAVAP